VHQWEEDETRLSKSSFSTVSKELLLFQIACPKLIIIHLAFNGPQNNSEVQNCAAWL
jgi:hypothetical protein